MSVERAVAIVTGIEVTDDLKLIEEAKALLEKLEN